MSIKDFKMKLINTFLLLSLCSTLFFFNCGETTDKKDSIENFDIITEVPFSIEVREVGNITCDSKNVGVQSGIIAVTEAGKWLVTSGRTNGYHTMKGENSTFPSKLSNKFFYLIDPVTKTAQKLPIPAKSLYFLQSTNMPYEQDGDVLYCAGGYGVDSTGTYHTFKQLTAINVEGAAQAIENQDATMLQANIFTNPYYSDTTLQSTGGDLLKVGDDFFLVFGHNYDRIYDGTTGIYTEAIHKFKINFDGKSIPTISNVETFTDPTGKTGAASEYHRRDLSVSTSVLTDGNLGMTVLGGVFTQQGGAYLNPIDIPSAISANADAVVATDLEQKTSLYDCGHLAMYDPVTNSMYISLVGGISGYIYDEAGTLVPDADMPFTRNITTILRNSAGSYIEHVQPKATVTYQNFIGGDAFFIPNPALATYGGEEEVMDYSQLDFSNGPVLAGHMYGGVLALGKDAGRSGSTANDRVYEIYISKK